MAVIAHIVGGLGNQMFQYAMGRSLSIATNQELKLDLTSMEKYTRRRFALGQFDIKATAAASRDLPATRKRSSVVRRMQQIWRSRSPGRHVVEKGQAFDPEVLGLTGPVYLEGYWQSEKYFSAISDTIRRDFNLASPFTPPRAAVLNRIKSSNAVSVHVRRGDYVTNPHANAVHGTLEPSWYQGAMSRMAERMGDVTFFVFSDDPAWARANLPETWPVIFIEPQDDDLDAQDMHLMAACRNHIIANSTFSWWGAWLNPEPAKHVIAPLNWFKSAAHIEKDLVPADWERL
ncbi:alpha-1,2-fucosyltransferase [Neorhizobium sp. Rsf11]|uniref:Alpha-1,2-fucosyltransferase n=2 Tax=Neorhizobium TaxID=1525371 RepID=A0ABV0LZ46_9HYPH|nr:alpha-1,2-fucosyltransferase [Neorhizobium petrolearium]MCC2612213.1 alpha-1,2-fucosyltransferase [Neorhizobium petrolearium]WGI67363.1 alpha-1,2-fucosyltransferase [Neorhizobium petrolearium]